MFVMTYQFYDNKFSNLANECPGDGSNISKLPGIYRASRIGLYEEQ